MSKRSTSIKDRLSIAYHSQKLRQLGIVQACLDLTWQALMPIVMGFDRPMPLSAKGGANAVNSQADSGSDSPPSESTPAVAIKKPKGVEKSKAAVTKKRGLKRL